MMEQVKNRRTKLGRLFTVWWFQLSGKGPKSILVYWAWVPSAPIKTGTVYQEDVTFN